MRHAQSQRTMPAHRLACIAAAALFALAALLAPATADTRQTCAPASQPPLPPGPLVGHFLRPPQQPHGFALLWKDLLNPVAGIPVDHYDIFRSPLQSLGMSLEPVGQVPGDVHEFVDQTVPPGDYLYWVKAGNCQGESQASNPASTTLPICFDSNLDSQAIPPLTYVYTDPSCTLGGHPCNITVQVWPPHVYPIGCGIGS
jgi:hypothetical protein